VVDEAHVYRGVFGSHVGNVLRRLRRMARVYGSEPQFLLASATIANPGELARLRDDASLMPTAVEEMIRWSTPVKEFMRTATADTTVRGVDIAKGESVYLAYVSGNRDEEVFDEPFRFDVGRDPNKHVAFGYGVHFCLGAALARMEVSSFFSELIPRLNSIELTGDPEYTATIFVGGPKHLPIRYSLR